MKGETVVDDKEANTKPRHCILSSHRPFHLLPPKSHLLAAPPWRLHPPPPPLPPPPWPRREVWMALAGPFARLPSEGGQVYYFPRGHAEQCGGVHHFTNPPLDEAIPCIVSSVELHYHAVSGDPYAVITLLPDQGPAQPPAAPEHEELTATRYYVKPVGTNDRSPFHVPKACAEGLFPLLADDQEEQPLPMVDVHGNIYGFRHTRNSKGGNILTEKWNDFSNDKQLASSLGKDPVVFVSLAQGGHQIGLRRGGPSTDLALELVDHVRQAAQRAATRDSPFTVKYYPRQGWPFVVPRKEVDDPRVLNVGMDVRMTIPVDAHELRASNRLTPPFFQGVIAAVNNNKQWCKLQVNWYENPAPNSNVNVWQVKALADAVEVKAESVDQSSKKRKTPEAPSSSAAPQIKTE